MDEGIKMEVGRRIGMEEVEMLSSHSLLAEYPKSFKLLLIVYVGYEVLLERAWTLEPVLELPSLLHNLCNPALREKSLALEVVELVHHALELVLNRVRHSYALDYLHRHCEMAFIHCDLKPSNILLDGDLCAHVSDFGLTKIFSTTNEISIHQQSSSIGIRGTIGYVAPKYGMGEEVSTQGDMYSYGMLLLEMSTGKRPTSNMFIGNVNLHSYVKMCLLEQVMKIIDPQIILEMEEEPSRSMQSSTTNISKLKACLVPVFQIGVLCSAEMPSERMSVKDVLKEQHKLRNIFLGIRGQRHEDR
ncbi:probable LRR receptor-like serine/threonine-protein kinase At3g47570 [Camellia sinensis]|uniref:probable LRR receptor-like serine/threonine-protein kinase At3g47570 n=1 Tax=Camellia sinensis TaxID=4442 RepID=UPI001036C4DD|nr:probable LRR receptor-like serine/threonine-protein kinase At3g47570 [Camellia sinensis]